MKAVIQRVARAHVSVERSVISKINHGYVILMGIYEGDVEKDIKLFVKKVAHLRIIQDTESEKMNLSIIDSGGEILLISQFTLCGDLSYGRRPSFHKAMKPKGAQKLYQKAVQLFDELGIPVKTGKFGHYMDVEIHNDGPVTIIFDSKD